MVTVCVMTRVFLGALTHVMYFDCSMDEDSPAPAADAEPRCASILDEDADEADWSRPHSAVPDNTTAPGSSGGVPCTLDNSVLCYAEVSDCDLPLF